MRAKTTLGQTFASIEYGNYCQFQEQNAILPIEKFLSLVLPRNTLIVQLLIIQFPLIICQVVAYGRLKTK